MPPTSVSTAITLAGMRFHVLVGILPHERALPQPLEVDLTVHREAGSAPVRGRTVEGDVLDYRTLYALVARVAAGPIEYLEQAAETILADALALPTVRSARVAVRKPHVALAGPLAHAEVVMEAHRG